MSDDITELKKEVDKIQKTKEFNVIYAELIKFIEPINELLVKIKDNPNGSTKELVNAIKSFIEVIKFYLNLHADLSAIDIAKDKKEEDKKE